MINRPTNVKGALERSGRRRGNVTTSKTKLVVKGRYLT
jgi:hypothetical protein